MKLCSEIRRTAGLLLVLHLLLAPVIAHAQTAGSGHLASIEAKVNAIDANDKEVASLNRKRMESYEAEADKLKKLQNELRELEERKAANAGAVQKRLDDLLHRIEHDQSWKNRRASAQSGWKERNPGLCSAGGPPPICPADHWQRISVSTAMAEYERFKNEVINGIKDELDKFDSGIERKKAEIATFQSSENEFELLRAKCDQDMTRLASSSDDLRAEIVALSKAYKESVVDQAKSMQSVWIGHLMQIIAEKHYIEDRIDIYNVKLADLKADEEKAVAESKEKTARQNEADIRAVDQKIAAHTTSLPLLQQELSRRLASWQQALSTHGQSLADVERLLAKAVEPELTRLKAQKAELQSRIATVRNESNQATEDHKRRSDALTGEIRQLQDQRWKLVSQLAERQEQALKTIRNVFATRRTLLTDALAARRASLQVQGDLLIQKKAEYRSKFLTYAGKVDQERQRLVAACSKSGASCFGIDTHSTIVMNWNKTLGCVDQMENTRSQSAVYGCQEEGGEYKSYYKNNLSGLSDADRSALSRRVSKTKYDMIFQKIQD
ncbi:hypothetical protein LJY25_03700 [Hymenobacter sp. BT175]|uniref:hypothetical protein n=1 Tax=Hymenobacter translucens TaxID=2886507 RepID=UPI001D0EA559|nr:hypothetical protein [Hymenobacter translucens]MCC2545536.1 hypothetical protein [Hymenobacter translucens]